MQFLLKQHNLQLLFSVLHIMLHEILITLYTLIINRYTKVEIGLGKKSLREAFYADLLRHKSICRRKRKIIGKQILVYVHRDLFRIE